MSNKPETTPYPRRSDKDQAAWLADKIVALGDYAKEAAQLLRRWPDTPMTISDKDISVVRKFLATGDKASDAPLAALRRIEAHIDGMENAMMAMSDSLGVMANE